MEQSAASYGLLVGARQSAYEVLRVAKLRESISTL